MEKQLSNEYVFKALVELQKHRGRQNAVSMAELYEKVYGETPRDKISSTRPLRRVLTELRKMGFPVCSVMTGKETGYFLAETAEEIESFCETMEKRVMKTLYLLSRVKKLSLPEYLGQLKLKEVEK